MNHRSRHTRRERDACRDGVPYGPSGCLCEWTPSNGFVGFSNVIAIFCLAFGALHDPLDSPEGAPRVQSLSQLQLMKTYLRSGMRVAWQYGCADYSSSVFRTATG